MHKYSNPSDAPSSINTLINNIKNSLNAAIDNIIELKNITSDGLILDFELKEAYDFNKVSKNTDVFGVYKEFIVGSNTISWTDNITKIEVTPNWRYL